MRKTATSRIARIRRIVTSTREPECRQVSLSLFIYAPRRRPVKSYRGARVRGVEQFGSRDNSVDSACSAAHLPCTGRLHVGAPEGRSAAHQAQGVTSPDTATTCGGARLD